MSEHGVSSQSTPDKNTRLSPEDVLFTPGRMSESNLKKVEAEVKQLREQLDSCGKYATTSEACKEYASHPRASNHYIRIAAAHSSH